MENNDNDDVFEDFGNKIEGKKESHKSHEPHKSHPDNLDDEEKLKWRYQEEKQALKDKYKKEMKSVEEKRTGEFSKHVPAKKLASVERITYIAIVVILLGYLVVDLSFIHGDKTTEVIVQQDITATVVQEENISNETVEEEVEEPVVEEPVEEEVQLSGLITFAIDRIYSEVDENNDEVGEINRISFTIYNGVDDVLLPVVNVYVYDEDTKEYYETRSRGEYTFPAGIAPGKTHTGSVDLSPKKFSNLNLKKQIRLVLNDSEDGFIKVITDDITIS